mgnify:CR=1 FL=1
MSHTNNIGFTLATLFCCSCLVSGCAMAWGKHEFTPVARYVTAPENCNNHVDIFRKGETSKRPGYRIAAVAAHGNGYANQETLEKTILEEANKVCADFVIITAGEVTKDETIGTYSGGIMIANQIQRPHLYGIAYRYAKVALGINLDKDGIIEYVRSGSTAEKSGLKEGCKLLTVNGIFVKSDVYSIEREILIKNPGDTVHIEYMDKEGNKNNKDIVLEGI